MKPAGGEAQLAYDDVDVADRGLGEAAAPRRLLLGLGEPGSAVPIQAAVARYGSASSFLEWRQHGAARIARPPSAVVKRPRHLATVPDDGTVQLDRADHTRRQGATAPRTSTGRRRKRPAEGRRRRLLLKLRRGNQCDEGKAAIGLLSNNQQLHSQIARFFSFSQLNN